MKIYDSVFYGALFFLLGNLISSALNFYQIILATLIFSIAIFLFGYLKENNKNKIKLFWFSGLSFFIIFGSLYYFSFLNYQKLNTQILFNKPHQFIGVVINVSKKENSQNLLVEMQKPYSGVIAVNVRKYPFYQYGDQVKFFGIISEPKNTSGYFLKNNIAGASVFPQNEIIAHNQGNQIKASLLNFKTRIVSIFDQALDQEKSAFLAGITLGEKTQFSKEFSDQLSKSGTTHIVALSGYNITILVDTALIIFGLFLTRAFSFFWTIIVIILFVVMSGAEASVVRAAFMGTLVLIAKKSQRIYSVRNAMVFAALLMVLANPAVISFDIGFQLSFMALFGIVYLEPIVSKYLNKNKNQGVLKWRENFVGTVSAQLAVAPILLFSFGNFSFVSILANVLILSAIPLTMALGFFIGFIGLFSLFIAKLVALPVNLFLVYELFIIKFFGSFSGFQIKTSITFILAYYFILALIIYFDRIKELNRLKKEKAIIV